MSAIVGVCRTDGQPVSTAEISRMVSALAHRVTDGGGIWQSGPAGLGHGAVRPQTSGAPRPFVSRAGNVIVADARIDNRSGLLADLGSEVGSAADVGDAELIVQAWERWGEACVPKLLGDFAFAIWDPRNRQLFCARDHVGVKPFYYHRGATAFLFASEIKALFTSTLVPYGLNPLRVADHLVGCFDDAAITYYRDIHRLPAGHTLTVGASGARLARYWAPDASRELALGSDAEYAEAFRECFTEAVRCRLRGGPVGALLSGGLDSSSIVATTRRLREGGLGPLDTFSAVFPGLPAADLRRIDERGFVQAVVAQGGVRANHVRGDLLSPLTDVDRALWHLDGAFAAPNLYMHWALYKAAQARGIRVLLDGVDGDTTVSHGLERLPELARTGRWVTLGRELRSLSGRHHASSRYLLWDLTLRPIIPAALRCHVRRLRGREGAFLATSLIRPEFASRMGVLERVAGFRRVREEALRTARQTHRAGLLSGLIPYALEMGDAASSVFHVEPRYPFFDRRLMELCLSFPASQKLQGGWTRVVMRRAMSGVLPEQVRWRSTKANLVVNFRRQLLAKDHHLMSSIVSGACQVIEEYVDVRTLRQVLARCVTGKGSDGDALMLFNAAILGLWLQRAKIV